MADTITPISNLAQIGLIKDMPPVSLPPNAFTDVQNVRFRHNSVYKMQGEKQIDRLTPSQLGVTGGRFVFLTEWANPNLGDQNSYYIIVIRDDSAGTDHVVLVHALPLDLTNPEYQEIGTTDNLGTWQSTTFQGGFAIILNNGLDIPYYLLDTEDGTDFANFRIKQLPNWDYYVTTDKIIDVTYDARIGTPGFSCGTLIDFANFELLVEAYDDNGTLRGSITVTGDGTYQHGSNDALYVTTDSTSNTTLCTPAYTGTSALLDGERFVVYKRSLNTIDVRCNLIKSYRDFLIAGDLRIIDTTDGTTIRQLPGIIRTSNIAAPGSLPNNWNPYITGVNTADEIQLATTGIIRDMVPLQNSMVIYTDRSIHTLNLTGNPNSPFSVINISDNYGALTLDSVIEFDGRHLVIGNNDIYIFGGHPGSIQSVAENKVRDYFYNDFNAGFPDQLYVFRNLAKDEIWIQYPSGTSEKANKSLIYNYKLGVWTIRKMSEMHSGFAGRISTVVLLDGGDSATTSFTTTITGVSSSPTAAITGVLSGGVSETTDFDATRRYPIFCDEEHIYYGEANDEYTLHEGGTYESYVKRIEMPMTPEFDVEQMNSLAIWATRYSPSDISFYIYLQTHNNPTGDDFVVNENQYEFLIGEDYKVDVRQTGRFFDYKLSDWDLADNHGTALPWAISGLQVKLGKRGAR